MMQVALQKERREMKQEERDRQLAEVAETHERMGKDWLDPVGKLSSSRLVQLLPICRFYCRLCFSIFDRVCVLQFLWILVAGGRNLHNTHVSI